MYDHYEDLYADVCPYATRDEIADAEHELEKLEDSLASALIEKDEDAIDELQQAIDGTSMWIAAFRNPYS